LPKKKKREEEEEEERTLACFLSLSRCFPSRLLDVFSLTYSCFPDHVLAVSLAPCFLFSFAFFSFSLSLSPSVNLFNRFAVRACLTFNFDFAFEKKLKKKLEKKLCLLCLTEECRIQPPLHKKYEKFKTDFWGFRDPRKITRKPRRTDGSPLN
jgi:hypothetical protein